MGPLVLGLGLLLLGLSPQAAHAQAAAAPDASPEQFTLHRLVAAQREEGRWSVDDLASAPAHEPPCPCAEEAHALDDAGLTSLVLLVLLEQGSTQRRGPYKQAVGMGLRFLHQERLIDPGELIGPRARDGWIYDHALATLALGEIAKADRNPVVRLGFQRALSALSETRIPESAWGARVAANPGSEDVFVTALAVSSFELASAGWASSGFEVDEGYRAHVLSWLDAVTDPESGEVPGPERVTVRAATAAALWTRVQLGSRVADDPLVARGLHALLERRRMFLEDGYGCELRGVLTGSLAAFGAGDTRAWTTWDGRIRATLDYDPQESPSTARALIVRGLCASVHDRYMHVLVR